MATMPEYRTGREGYDGVVSSEPKHREILLIPQPSKDPRDPLVSLIIPQSCNRFCGPICVSKKERKKGLEY